MTLEEIVKQSVKEVFGESDDELQYYYNLAKEIQEEAQKIKMTCKISKDLINMKNARSTISGNINIIEDCCRRVRDFLADQEV